MKIIKILIDEFPKSCYECDLSGDYHDMGDADCIVIKESIIGFTKERHPDCPLRLVWTTSYAESGIIKP